ATPPPDSPPLSLHDALPIWSELAVRPPHRAAVEAALELETRRLPAHGEAAAGAVAAAVLVELAAVAGAELDVPREGHVRAEPPAVRGAAVARAVPVGLGADRHGLQARGPDAERLRVRGAGEPEGPRGAH